MDTHARNDSPTRSMIPVYKYNKQSNNNAAEAGVSKSDDNKDGGDDDDDDDKSFSRATINYPPAHYSCG